MPSYAPATFAGAGGAVRAPVRGMPEAWPASLGAAAVTLVLAAVLYNTVLAFLKARGMPVTLPMVIMTEFMILAATGFTLLRSGFHRTDAPALLLFVFFLFNGVLISLVNGVVTIEMARNAAVMALFLMIGFRATESAVKRTFAITAALMFAVLLLESVSVLTYARMFEPGLYFEQTRGITRNEYDEIGLFANALGFEDRFAILNIVAHRTSSLYLEQVSLANFAIILTVFMVSLWRRIPVRLRVGYVLLIAFILVTNNSRTALAITLAAPLVYYVAPKLPRLVPLMILPGILLAAFVVTLVTPPSGDDTFVGRVWLTVTTLRELDLAAVLGARATEAATFADSGYTFVIYGASIFGLLALWFFLGLIVAGHGADQKRAGMMMALYLLANLLVSGTSVFSIKTAALLWLLIGFLRREEVEKELAPSAVLPEGARA
jgi:hypothetical protein